MHMRNNTCHDMQAHVMKLTRLRFVVDVWKREGRWVGSQLMVWKRERRCSLHRSSIRVTWWWVTNCYALSGLLSRNAILRDGDKDSGLMATYVFIPGDIIRTRWLWDFIHTRWLWDFNHTRWLWDFIHTRWLWDFIHTKVSLHVPCSPSCPYLERRYVLRQTMSVSTANDATYCLKR